MPSLSQLLALTAVVALPPVSSQQLGANATNSSAAAASSPFPLLYELPECALDCLLPRCPDRDLPCLCIEQTLQAKDAACLQATCSFSNVSFAMNLTHTSCGFPLRDRSAKFKGTNAAVGMTTFLIGGVRLGFKWSFSARHGFGLDDWLVVATAVVGIPAMAVNVFGLGEHGLGKDIWTLKPESVVLFARFFYAQEVLYIVLSTLSKLSLSAFFLRLFSGNTFRKVALGTIGAQVALGVAFAIKVLIQCYPASYYWTQYSDANPSDGYCNDINASAWVNAVANVAMDFWLMAVPLTQLYQLNIGWTKKMAAGIMFMTGAIVTAISCLRMSALDHFGRSTNPTWDQWSVASWSTVELNVGVICSCLPTLRLILGHLWPRVFASSLALPTEPSTERAGNSGGQIELSLVEAPPAGLLQIEAPPAGFPQIEAPPERCPEVRVVVSRHDFSLE